jgi:hypothetical protein
MTQVKGTHTLKKLILGLAATATIAVPLALAGPANAATTDVNGVVNVSKGEVQTALGWNNPAFDKGAGSLKFTAGAEKIIDYPMTCFNLNTGAQTSGGHRLIVQTGKATVTATPVYNAGNGKQITGFNLTGQTNGFAVTGGTVRDVTCGEDTVLFMNDGLAVQNPVSVTGGLMVNGMDLIVAPYVAPVV